MWIKSTLRDPIWNIKEKLEMEGFYWFGWSEMFCSIHPWNHPPVNSFPIVILFGLLGGDYKLISTSQQVGNVTCPLKEI